MIPYYIIYASILALLFKEEYNVPIVNKKIPNHFIIYFIMVSFSALRGNGDGDYFNYINGYSSFQTIESIIYIQHPFERGFRILAFIGNVFNLPAQSVIIFMSVITLTIVYKIVKIYSPNPAFSLVLYFPVYLLFDMHHSRASVAIAIGMLAFHYYNSHKMLKSVITIFVACLFHKSAAILFVIPLLRYLNFSNKTVFALFIGLYITVSFVNLNDVISSLLSLMKLGALKYKFDAYTSNPRWSYSFSLFDPRLILNSFVYFSSTFILWKSGTHLEKESERNAFKLFFFGLIFTLLFSSSTIMVVRQTAYFSVYIIIIIPIYINKISDSNVKSVRILNKNIPLVLYLKNFRIELTSSLMTLGVIMLSIASISKQVEYFLFF